MRFIYKIQNIIFKYSYGVINFTWLIYNDIIDLGLIDKVNYMIAKDNLEEITVYTEYIIQMLFDLLFKLNEAKRK